jgi:PAS domain S-box-containing protein
MIMYFLNGVNRMLLVPLLQNMALIVTMLLIYQFLERRFTRNTVWVRILSGILFGIAGVIGMLSPLKITTGLIYDGRSIILAVSGIFAGPVAAIVAGLMCLAYRLWLGGPGVIAGTMVIVESVILGSLYGHLAKTKKIKMNLLSLSILGLTVHVLMLAMQMFIPNRGWVDVIPRIAPAVLLAYPVIFLFVCRIFIDADDRRSEHEALLESEARYRGIFENNRAAMLLIDPSNGRIIDANTSAIRFYGWSLEELKSMRIGQINLLGDEATQILRNKALMSEQNQFLLQHRTKTNGIKDVDIYSGPIPFGKRTLLHSIIHDVTSSEEALRERAMLFDAIDRSFNEVFIFDAETLRYSYANRGALENLGYTMDVLRTMTPMDLKTELSEPELRSVLDELSSGKRSIAVLQTALKRADGSA